MKRPELKKIFFPGLLFCLLLAPAAGKNININDDFDIEVTRETENPVLVITLIPGLDHKIGALSPQKPFISLQSEECSFAAGGQIFQKEYITREVPGEYRVAFSPDLEILPLVLNITYVACSISKGTCDLPRTEQLSYQVKKSSPGLSGSTIRTLILGGLFLLALSGVLLYLKFRREVLFTSLMLLIFTGILYYSFTEPVFYGRTQAAISLDIASTLCFSCIGLETGKEDLEVDRIKTQVYTELPQPVLITLFTAPWCGSCKTAKQYLDRLYREYRGKLQYQVIDISLEEGKNRFAAYAAKYSFKQPLPLPALVVSSNNKTVLYGTAGLEDKLLEMILNAEK